MLDDLRNSASYQDEFQPPAEEEQELLPGVPAHKKEPFLGMTASQQFVIALLLFFMVCLLGSFFLLITERIIPPMF